jgi:hypothetical protein
MCQNLSYSVWKLNGKIEVVQSMIVKETDLISEKWTNWTPNFTWNLTTPSTNSHSMKRFSSLNTLQSAAHFIRPHGINYHQLQSCLKKTDAEYGNFMYNLHSWGPSGRTVLKHLLTVSLGTKRSWMRKVKLWLNSVLKVGWDLPLSHCISHLLNDQ